MSLLCKIFGHKRGHKRTWIADLTNSGIYQCPRCKVIWEGMRYFAAKVNEEGYGKFCEEIVEIDEEGNVVRSDKESFERIG